MEPAAPPRFAQSLGAGFLILGSLGLFLATRDTTVWWVLGWGPALAVAVVVVAVVIGSGPGAGIRRRAWRR